MRQVLRYFRDHPWQCRAVTGSLAAILGVAAAWAALPVLRDRKIISLLASESAFDRERGVIWAVEVGSRRPRLVRLLEARLRQAGDEEFAAIAEALIRMGRFDVPGRAGEQIDRLSAIHLDLAGEGAESLPLRRILLNRLIRAGRDNPHVRRALQTATDDAEPEMRAAAALLAAGTGDESALRKLLRDRDHRVRAAAALDAALAGRNACVDSVVSAFENPQGDEELASAAYALARLSPERFAGRIVARIEKASDGGNRLLLERLLHVAPLLGRDAAGEAVLSVLRRADRSGRLPPTQAFIAAGRMGLAQAADSVLRPMRQLPRKAKVNQEELSVLGAAVNAARRLALPATRELALALARLWDRKSSLAMLLTAEALAEQEPAPSPAEDEPTPETADIEVGKINFEGPITEAEVQAVLRAAAECADPPAASAAAAAALFRRAPDRAESAVRSACEADSPLAGDLIAWELARAPSHREHAWRLAEALFARPQHNDAVRSAGAILVALLARCTDQAGPAIRAIEGKLRGERDPFVGGAYRCALLTLGRRDLAEDVADLARSDRFGRRRALTALVLAGEPAGWDMVLGGEEFDPVGIDLHLTGLLMARVYGSVEPALPAFDVDAGRDVRHWQCRILRDFYLIHRRGILDRMDP